MSQVITNAFETYWQGCLTDQVPVVLDEVVLADIPNLDITAPIDPNTGLPPQAQIVHRHPVDQRGRINNNAVAYSIVMDTTVGNFSFNAMYLINKASGMVGMIVYKGRETKTKTDPATGTTGNSLVKSMLMEYDQAATATVTTVEAGTWQIDYSARLLGMDEQLRQQALLLFGSAAFFDHGFKLINKAGGYKVQPGVAMVGGLRIQLDTEQAVTVGAKPVGVWVDVHHAGTILSRWDNHFEFKTSTTDLADYTDTNGYRHYVARLGTIGSDDVVTDRRAATTHRHLWGDIIDPPEFATRWPKKSEIDGLEDDLQEVVSDVNTLNEKLNEALRETNQAFLQVRDEIERTSPVGIAEDWPSEVPPDGWVCYMGQAFDKNANPKLAELFPSGVLPDLRGEFIRGWDNGRGVNPDRKILSLELDELKSHKHPLGALVVTETGSGAVGGVAQSGNIYISETQLTGGNETRPRSVAMNKIVRKG